MCDFKPGDEVVCVNATPRIGRVWGGTPPIVGEIYTVRYVIPDPLYMEAAALILCEIENLDLGYAASRFRKVERRKTDLSIESFLTIKPGFEEPRRPKAPAKKERA